MLNVALFKNGNMNSPAPRRFVRTYPEKRSPNSILERIEWWLFPSTRLVKFVLDEVFPGTPEYDNAPYTEIILNGKYPCIMFREEN